jgi:hypothetical protein
MSERRFFHPFEEIYHLIDLAIKVLQKFRREFGSDCT